MQRVEELLAQYSAHDACAAALLCDRHDPGALAYRIIAHDLSTQDLSYGELRHESERFAAVLQSLGIGPGDRVATLMGKSRQYLATLLGIWRLGAVHVPLFTAFAPSAIALRLTGSGARAVVCDAAQRAKLAPGGDMPANSPWRVITTGTAAEGALSFCTLMEQAEPGISAAAMGGDAPFIHIYTSGTTGSPKGVVVPMRALAAFHAYTEFGFDLRPDDVFWCAADPGWAYGLYFGILATFTTGTPSILLEGASRRRQRWPCWAARALPILPRHQPSIELCEVRAWRRVRHCACGKRRARASR
jgi:acetyl-CoA synthetase